MEIDDMKPESNSPSKSGPVCGLSEGQINNITMEVSEMVSCHFVDALQGVIQDTLRNNHVDNKGGCGWFEIGGEVYQVQAVVTKNPADQFGEMEEYQTQFYGGWCV